MSRRTRLTGREQSPPSLVQNRLKRLEASPDGIDVNHRLRISARAAEARQFPDSFVAFLSVSRFFPSDSVVLAQALSCLPRGDFSIWVRPSIKIFRNRLSLLSKLLQHPAALFTDSAAQQPTIMMCVVTPPIHTDSHEDN